MVIPVAQLSVAILWLVCLYLFLLGTAVLMVPKRSLQFLSAFAQTPRANLIEAALRFVAGVAFIGAAPLLTFPTLASIIGLFLTATALAFVAAPGLHRRFAGPAVAAVARKFPLFGIASIALSLLLAVFIA